MLVKSTVFVIFSFAFVFRNIFGRPSDTYSKTDPLTVCYSLKCPEGTFWCGKNSEISPEDKTKLNVQIRCYDDDGNILNSKNETETNPFGPHVYYKGSKITAVIKMFPSYLYNDDPDSNEEDKETSYNVPNYAEIPKYPVAKSGPKSEVEDLESR